MLNKDSVAVCESLFIDTKLKPHSSVFYGAKPGMDLRDAEKMCCHSCPETKHLTQPVLAYARSCWGG